MTSGVGLGTMRFFIQALICKQKCQRLLIWVSSEAF
jgi:hypothetical protein